MEDKKQGGDGIRFARNDLRIYDVDLAEGLERMFAASSMKSKNDFLVSVLRQDYESLKDKDLSKEAKQEKKTERRAWRREAEEIEVFLRNSNKAIYAALSKVLAGQKKGRAMLSRVYGIELMKVSDATKEAIESGAFDDTKIKLQGIDGLFDDDKDD